MRKIKYTLIHERPFKGVYRTPYGRYASAIRYGCSQHHLGTFSTPLEAAGAYNEAAARYFGEFACLNPVNCDMLLVDMGNS